MPPWTLLIWLASSFLLLIALRRWIGRHLRGTVLLLSHSEEAAAVVYFVLLLPGVLLHEGSHWLMAKLLRVRTGKFSIGLVQRRGGQLEMGSVRVARTDSIRSALIGLAPLIGGSLAIFLIGHWVLKVGTLARVVQGGDAGDVASALWGALHVADFWLWLYLIFAISNAMLPSASDRRAWPHLLLFLGILTAVLYLTGWAPTLSAELAGYLSDALNYLNLALALTLAADALFALLILLMETLLTHLTGWQVEY